MLYKPSDKKRELELNDSTDLNYRNFWHRDYGRLIHSPSFRRLQGKQQLFPGYESDFFRNRLTHSLEVAQVAKSITRYLNNNSPIFKDSNNNISEEIVEIAALAHDLGHPPFGHIGEKALDNKMKPFGGFEGNAQTLRLLAKIEKKDKEEKTTNEVGVTETGEDGRYGLNLTHRVLASVIKYDNCIEYSRTNKKSLAKGYYESEKILVNKIKENVLGSDKSEELRTVEAQIMDIADDIAYSTYDLEDAFKAGFITILDLLNVPDKVLEIIKNKLNDSYNGEKKFTIERIKQILFSVFNEFFNAHLDDINEIYDLQNKESIPGVISSSYEFVKDLAFNGYQRTSLTSSLINAAINSIQAKEHKSKNIVLTEIFLSDDIREKVEVLKYFTYETIINSNLVAIPAYRGYEIVQKIFDVLCDNDERDAKSLLPKDYLKLVESIDSKYQKRVICDFIAGMTDRYAIEFYGRLVSENPQTIFKPL